MAPCIGMGAVWLLARRRLALDWRGLVASGILLGLGFGLCLASIAAARKTASAYDRILVAADAPDAAVAHGSALDPAVSVTAHDRRDHAATGLRRVPGRRRRCRSRAHQRPDRFDRRRFPARTPGPAIRSAARPRRGRRSVRQRQGGRRRRSRRRRSPHVPTLHARLVRCRPRDRDRRGNRHASGRGGERRNENLRHRGVHACVLRRPSRAHGVLRQQRRSGTGLRCPRGPRGRGRRAGPRVAGGAQPGDRRDQGGVATAHPRRRSAWPSRLRRDHGRGLAGRATQPRPRQRQHRHVARHRGRPITGSIDRPDHVGGGGRSGDRYRTSHDAGGIACRPGRTVARLRPRARLFDRHDVRCGWSARRSFSRSCC